MDVKHGARLREHGFIFYTSERKILRTQHGPATAQGVWRTRTVHELGGLYKTADLVADIERRRRLKWLGRVIRMDQTGVDKKVSQNVQEKCECQWLKDAENDLRVPEVKRWRRKENNREELSSVVKETKYV
jgi:hypothetical protein